MSRFWRFLGPGGYRVDVATSGNDTIHEHMEPAPDAGRSTFMSVRDENGLMVYVDTDSYDRIVEIPYLNKTDRKLRS